MNKSKKNKNKIKAVIHETALDHHEDGINDKQTILNIGISCLNPMHNFMAQEIRAFLNRKGDKKI